MAKSLVVGNPLALLGRMAVIDSWQLSALWACGEATMTEAELKEIREMATFYCQASPDNQVGIAFHALLAHIDAQAAEVERLKETNRLMGNEIDRGTQYLAQASELRDLVREAERLLIRYVGRDRIVAWLEKAKGV